MLRTYLEDIGKPSVFATSSLTLSPTFSRRLRIPLIARQSGRQSERESQRWNGFYISALRLALTLLLGCAWPLPAQVNVLTCHNDNARTGLNPNETRLNR